MSEWSCPPGRWIAASVKCILLIGVSYCTVEANGRTLIYVESDEPDQGRIYAWLVWVQAKMQAVRKERCLGFGSAFSSQTTRFAACPRF